MATASVQNISPTPMLGCVLEVVAVERLVKITEALLLLFLRVRRIPGFEQAVSMEIGVSEAHESLSMLKGSIDECRPSVGGDIIDGSDSRVKVPSKTNVTSTEVGECKDAGSDDDDDDDDDDEDDDDQEEDIGDGEDDLSPDEGEEDDQDNNDGGGQANGNEEEEDDDEDDADGEDDDDDEDEDDEDEDDEEDEEPPTKKKK